jgi:hypothetical protein
MDERSLLGDAFEKQSLENLYLFTYLQFNHTFH